MAMAERLELHPANLLESHGMRYAGMTFNALPGMLVVQLRGLDMDAGCLQGPFWLMVCS